MSLRAGDYDSSGAWDGTYWDWGESWIPLVVSVVSPEMKAEVETPSCLREVAYKFEVENSSTGEITTIASQGEDECEATSHITQGSWSKNVESQSDPFSLTFANSSAVSPRLVNDLSGKLSDDITTRIIISAGFRYNDGTTELVRVYQGILTDRSEMWQENGSGMAITGLSLGYLLTLAPAPVQDYQGTLSGLLMDILEGIGLDSYVFMFDDRLFTESLDIASNSVEEAFEALFEFDKSIEWHVDEYGIVTFRKLSFDPESSFVYKTGPGGNVKKIVTNSSISQVVTEVTVLGGNAAGTLTYVDAVGQVRFGRRTSSVTSSLITTTLEATQAAIDEIDKSRRALHRISIPSVFNPVLGLWQTVDLQEPSLNSSYAGKVSILNISFSFDGDGLTSSVSGELDQEV